MRRSRRPVLDPLEDRAMLAAAHIPHALAHHAHYKIHHPAHHKIHHPAHHAAAKPPVVQSPPIPISPTPTPISPSATATEISSSLRTDKASYNAGDPITITLTETNTSNQAVSIHYGPSLDGVSVSKDGTTVWRSNAGIQPMFIGLITLQPGESHTFTAVWNDEPNSDMNPGVTNGGPVTGTLQVSAHFEGVTVTPVTITVG